MSNGQSYSFSICRLISSLGVIGTLVFTMAPGYGLVVFINIPSLIILFGLSFFLLLGKLMLNWTPR